jgi:hypothetical protein
MDGAHGMSVQYRSYGILQATTPILAMVSIPIISIIWGVQTN